MNTVVRHQADVRLNRGTAESYELNSAFNISLICTVCILSAWKDTNGRLSSATLNLRCRKAGLLQQETEKQQQEVEMHGASAC